MSRGGPRRAAAPAALVFVLGTLAACDRPAPDAGVATDPIGESAVVVDPADPLRLYFPGWGGRLRAEERPLAEPAEGEARLRAVVEALLAGPVEDGLRPPFPEEVELASIFLSPDGVAFVDLGSDAESPPQGGSLGEMLSVYSLVNSVLLNVPEARRVAVLWNGIQRPSFAGHLDTSRPLPAKRDLLAGS